MLICGLSFFYILKDIFAGPINIAGTYLTCRVRSCTVFDHHNCNFLHPPHHHQSSSSS